MEKALSKTEVLTAGVGWVYWACVRYSCRHFPNRRAGGGFSEAGNTNTIGAKKKRSCRPRSLISTTATKAKRKGTHPQAMDADPPLQTHKWKERSLEKMWELEKYRILAVPHSEEGL